MSLVYGESAGTAGSGFDRSRPFRSWDTLFLSLCEVLGKREEGQRLVDEFEARLDELAVRRSEKGALSVARIEFYEPGSFSYRGQNEDTAALMKRSASKSSARNSQRTPSAWKTCPRSTPTG